MMHKSDEFFEKLFKKGVTFKAIHLEERIKGIFYSTDKTRKFEIVELSRGQYVTAKGYTVIPPDRLFKVPSDFRVFSGSVNLQRVLNPSQGTEIETEENISEIISSLGGNKEKLARAFDGMALTQ